ncbi:unnamed protein product [Protopolystoma xenopodis]|uniref:Uncharacterized protein n=1 Tax=Protopolystoma xenopodis TaxID=117903 RepID=A0A3S5BUT1_9PLAT|nr:unnamed protein product [Protopolystoma xenopodis]
MFLPSPLFSSLRFDNRFKPSAVKSLSHSVTPDPGPELEVTGASTLEQMVSRCRPEDDAGGEEGRETEPVAESEEVAGERLPHISRRQPSAEVQWCKGRVKIGSLMLGFCTTKPFSMSIFKVNWSRSSESESSINSPPTKTRH